MYGMYTAVCVYLQHRYTVCLKSREKSMNCAFVVIECW